MQMFPALVVSLSVSVLTIGLVAGYVLAFANSVMPGLKRADNYVFVAANQWLNVAVHNPVFMVLSNIGPAGLLAAAILQFISPIHPFALVLTLIALGLYGVTLAVTLGINVPMNDRLIELGTVTDGSKLSTARTQFERPWTRMNMIRTWTTTGSAAAALGSLLIVCLA